MQDQAPLTEQPVGVVTHYWNHLGVAGVHLDEPVDVGDHIHVRGHTTDFEQDVDSMQIEHQDILHAKRGDEVGIRVAGHAHEHDRVYKYAPEDIAEDENVL